MIIVDTNVVSELMRADPEPIVRDWIDSVRVQELWTTAIAALELKEGVLVLPDSRKKARLTKLLELVFREDFADRILPFDLQAAEAAAEISADRYRGGARVEIRDMQIAGIAISRNAALATRNQRHFLNVGIEVINPWTHKA